MAKSRKDMQPYWRPNFVHSSELPDIKVVRTNFIVNSATVLIFLVVASIVAQKEYKAIALRNSIASLEERVTAANPADKANVALSQKFRSAAEHVVELEKFYITPFTPHEFLNEFARLRPKGLIFSRISVVETKGKTKKTNKQVHYKISVAGEVRSLTALDDFKSRVTDWEMLDIEGYVPDITETVRGRDKDTGIFPYNLTITLQPGKKEVKKAKGAAS